MTEKIGCIILAAGNGARMASSLPKPLHAVAGQPMITHVLAAASALAPEKIVVVIGEGMDDVRALAHPHIIAVQKTPNGTGGAVLAARDHFTGFDGDILVLFSDTPLVTPETLKKMIQRRRAAPDIGLVFAAMEATSPNSYGRMVIDDDGFLQRIVECKDATEAEKNLTLCNGGILCADGARLFSWLGQVRNDNAQKEYYLTDLPAIARQDRVLSAFVSVRPEEMSGVNSRADLARVERLAQDALRQKHMRGGATLIDPDTVYFSFDTVVGRDVVIEPNVVFGPGVVLGDNTRVLAHSHITGAVIAAGARIGPFARLRPGSRIGEGAQIGNFVEVKNSRIGAGAKAGHLTYLGDADVGAGANIGAGVITCNYDGQKKHPTEIGAQAFIGSNAALVAPVTVGEGAYVAAGSVITRAVPDDALAVARARQDNKPGWSKRKKKKEI